MTGERISFDDKFIRIRRESLNSGTLRGDKLLRDVLSSVILHRGRKLSIAVVIPPLPYERGKGGQEDEVNVGNELVVCGSGSVVSHEIQVSVWDRGGRVFIDVCKYVLQAVIDYL